MIPLVTSGMPHDRYTIVEATAVALKFVGASGTVQSDN